MATIDIDFYKDKSDNYRWRIKAENGRIIGASSQGFASKQKAQENADLLHDALYSGKWKAYFNVGNQ